MHLGCTREQETRCYGNAARTATAAPSVVHQETAAMAEEVQNRNIRNSLWQDQSIPSEMVVM